MSTIQTLSAFYFNTKVESTNYALDFDEGGGEIQASLDIGDYTMEELATEIARAMNVVGGQTYTCTLNRTTRIYTISASSNFSLLSFTGSRLGSSIWSTIGYVTTSDKTGANTYDGDNASGSEYRPQFILKDYIARDDFRVKEDAVVNRAVSGEIQSVTYGDGARIQMEINLITNKTGLNQSYFYSNATGKADALTFMNYLITKSKVEFMPDVSTRSTYYKVILESTEESDTGTQFSLKNMQVPDFYTTGPLIFREIS